MENITENNRLIAEFMGMQYREGGEPEKLNKEPYMVNNGDHIDLHKLSYHADWNWIMPVVEKIGKIDLEDGNYAYTRTFNMPSDEGKPMVRINRFSCHYGETLIEATYKAVIEFIKWYNDNQNPQPNESN